MCDFENGLCTLAQSSMDTFDWTRARGKTTSRGTGPLTDHTFGTPEGLLFQYLFVCYLLYTSRSCCVTYIGHAMLCTAM